MILLSIILAGFAAAADDFVFSKQVNPSRLQEELRQAGCSVLAIHGSGGKQWVQFDGDGGACDVASVIKAHVYVDPVAVKAVANAELADLKAKLKARTATQDEKDRLLEILLEGK